MDGLGSVRQVLDDAGVVQNTFFSDPWGTPEGSAVPPDFGFTGEWQDTGVGRVNLRARWYASGQGRFVSRDPFAGIPERPQMLAQ